MIADLLQKAIEALVHAKAAALAGDIPEACVIASSGAHHLVMAISEMLRAKGDHVAH